MSTEHYVALERGLAEIIGQFQDTPDLYLREADLHAALFAALERQELLRERYATRDGRWTSLLHREYPALFAYEPGLTGKDEGGRACPERSEGMKDECLPSPSIGRRSGQTSFGSQHICRANQNLSGDEGLSSFILPPYDLVLLNPRFVRAYDLEAVTNANPRRAASLRALPQGERPRPLLAAVNLALIDVEEGSEPTLPPAAMAGLEADFQALVRSEPDAERAYLAVFCRHWDPDGPLRQVLQALERWAETYRHIPLVFIQSYRDDVGRVFGGRYLNLWSYMAPLLPLTKG